MTDIIFSKYGTPENSKLRCSMRFAAEAVAHAMEIGFKADEYAAALRLATEFYEEAKSENFAAKPEKAA